MKLDRRSFFTALGLAPAAVVAAKAMPTPVNSLPHPPHRPLACPTYCSAGTDAKISVIPIERMRDGVSRFAIKTSWDGYARTEVQARWFYKVEWLPFSLAGSEWIPMGTADPGQGYLVSGPWAWPGYAEMTGLTPRVGDPDYLTVRVSNVDRYGTPGEWRECDYAILIDEQAAYYSPTVEAASRPTNC